MRVSLNQMRTARGLEAREYPRPEYSGHFIKIPDVKGVVFTIKSKDVLIDPDGSYILLDRV